MTDVYGESGAEWVTRLPQLVAELCAHWSLRLERRIEPLSYNYVIGATSPAGKAVILKVGYPCREQKCEIEALRVWDGRGGVRLLAADESAGALLLERLEPGDALEGVDDVEATSIAARVMRQLWRPAPPVHPFPTTADWGRGFARLRQRFGGGTGPFDEPLVAEAEEVFEALGATAGPAVVLHGDLHHGNILRSGGEWRAIDPKGVVGEPAYEPGALLRNPLSLYTSMSDPRAVTSRRLSQLADELSFDRERLRGWAFAQAVLSSLWVLEDHGRVGEYALACAEWLRGA